jgi:hypothetical protein
MPLQSCLYDRIAWGMRLMPGGDCHKVTAMRQGIRRYTMHAYNATHTYVHDREATSHKQQAYSKLLP